jgi:chromosomal replication initiator protein DnaA
MNNLTDLWNKFLKQIENIITDKVGYQTFYQPSKLLSLDNNIAEVQVDSEFAKITLNSQKDLIEIEFNKLTNGNYSIKYITEKDLIQAKTNEQNKIIKDETPDNLLSHLIFDSFVVGQSNKIAHAASVATAINPGTTYNPLFIYGNSGLGKTHLLNSIGNHIKKHNKSMKVFYIPCMEFVDEYITAIKNNKMDAFDQKFRSVDVLLVDDIQWLAGKQKSHEVFFHIFNYLINNKKQIVLTSDRHPQELSGLENRLVSRFSSGLSIGIDTPEFETALAILQKKIEIHNVDLESIDEEVLAFMANKFSNDIRLLEGKLNRLLFFSINFSKSQRITMDIALEAFKDDIVISTTEGILTVKKIKETIADYYNLTTSQLESKTRTSNVALARHMSMYLCRHLLDISFIKIGEEFGGRDHSTVISACDKVKSLMKTDENYRLAIAELKGMLK